MVPREYAAGDPVLSKRVHRTLYDSIRVRSGEASLVIQLA